MSATPTRGAGFQGQVVVIAGAATGIGSSAAQLLSSLGAFVVALDVDRKKLEDSVAALKDRGGGALALHCDCTDQASVSTAIEQAVAARGHVDVLLNCVGITGITGVPAHEIPVDDFDRVVAVNLRSAFLLSQSVLPGMLARSYGRILHVSSIAGKEGNPGMVSYSASKAGLIGMVKSMAKDYATSGITINALAPAVILTPLVEAMPAAQVALNTSKIPMGRLGTLDEVSDLIAWIVSPQASFTTGFTFDLSGGRATY